MRHIMTIEVRGRTFRSAQACADHFGVRRAVVYNALDKGKLEKLGLGHRHGQRRPFVYKDLSWPSQAAASRALGLNSRYVTKALLGGSGDRALLEGHLAAYHKKLQWPIKPWDLSEVGVTR
jgi:hypothetical protein